MDDQEAFLRTLVDAGMSGAALVYARARGLSEEGINFEAGEMKKPISEGKALKVGPRTRKIFDWPLKKVDDVVLEPLDDEEDAGAAKIDAKRWDDEQESSSGSGEAGEEAAGNGEKAEKKGQWSDDESDSAGSGEFEEGDAKPRLPDVLNPQCQAMKMLGLSKDSEKLQGLIAEVTESVNETGELPFTPSSLDKKLRKAGDAFSAGDFELSYQLFDEVYQKYKLLVVQGTVTQRQTGQIFTRIQNYLRALKAEILRRQESTPEERHPQLLMIFAKQKLDPEHRLLVLKLVMNKLRKTYTKQAKLCALELSKICKDLAGQIDGAEEIIQKAEKVLNDQKNARGFDERVNAVESLDDMPVDYAKLCLGDAHCECPCCESPASVKGICAVCGLGECV